MQSAADAVGLVPACRSSTLEMEYRRRGGRTHTLPRVRLNLAFSVVRMRRSLLYTPPVEPRRLAANQGREDVHLYYKKQGRRGAWESYEYCLAEATTR